MRELPNLFHHLVELLLLGEIEIGWVSRGRRSSSLLMEATVAAGDGMAKSAGNLEIEIGDDSYRPAVFN